MKLVTIEIPNGETLDTYSLKFDNWHKKWEAMALLGNAWYKGWGVNIETATADLIQNILAGKTTAELVKAQVSKGRAVIEKKKQERLKTATPLEDLF